MSDNLEYTLTELEGVKLVEASGYISVNTQMKFEDFIDKITDTDNVIIDMKSVSLLTAAGIESLVELSQNAYKKGRRVVLACIKPEVKDIAVMLSLYQFLIFAETREEALLKIRYYT
ncbi:MAG: STAS domain-containing protein [Spirochaetia bacterium]|jgi:anti-anti-sigma factor|nr:STAS domain-containing protein [Spirochaetia bacterium]